MLIFCPIFILVDAYKKKHVGAQYMMRIFFSPEVALAHPGPPRPTQAPKVQNDAKVEKMKKKIHKNRKNGQK